jgi:hypothetical protein
MQFGLKKSYLFIIFTVSCIQAEKLYQYWEYDKNPGL